MTHDTPHNLTYGSSLFSMKKLAPTGFFQGYASVFSVVDHHKEKVSKGAFLFSLSKWQQKKQWPKMLWQHDMTQPIGRWVSMREDQHGLFVQGQLLMDVAKGREAYALLKEGILDALSIGFLPVKSHYETSGKYRVLDQVDLHEVSLVTYGANPDARVTAVKSQPAEGSLDRLSQALHQLRAYT
jgi:hypothetical protein